LEWATQHGDKSFYQLGWTVKNWLLLWTLPHYTTVEKGLVWKDLTVEISCIPPQLNMWYMVVCIGGIGVLRVIISWWHKRNIWCLYFNFFSFLSSGMTIFKKSKMIIFTSNFKMIFSKIFHFKVFLMGQTKYFKFFSFLSSGMADSF
jgi:hypothetical protein